MDIQISQLREECNALFEEGNMDALLDKLPIGLLSSLQDAELYGLRAIAEIARENIEEGGKYADHALRINERNPKAQFAKGYALLQAGYPLESLPFLSKAIELEDSNYFYYAAIGNAYFATNDWTAASQGYEQAIKLLPEEKPELFLALAAAQLNNQHFTAALENYSKIKEDSSCRSQADSYVALCYYYLEEYEIAIDYANKAMAAGVSSVEVFTSRGLSYYETEKWELAYCDLRQLTQMPNGTSDNIYFYLGVCTLNLTWFEESIEWFRIAALQSVVPLSIYYYLGIALVRTKQYKEAIPVLTEGIKYGTTVKCYIERATAFLNTQQYRSAIDDLTVVIGEKVELSFSYHLRGGCFFELGEADKALIDFNAGLSIDSDNRPIYTDRGILYFQKGDYPAAMRDALHALELDPHSWADCFTIGNIYYQKKEYENAKVYFDRLIHAGQHLPDVYVGRANCNIELGLFYEALVDTDAALQIDNEYFAAKITKIWALYHLNNRLDLVMANQILETNPKDGVFYYYFARILRRHGNTIKAISMLETATLLIEKPIDLSLTHVYLGHLHEELAHKEQALACLDKAIELHPLHPAPFIKKASILLDTEYSYPAAIECLKAAQRLDADHPLIGICMAALPEEIIQEVFHLSRVQAFNRYMYLRRSTNDKVSAYASVRLSVQFEAPLSTMRLLTNLSPGALSSVTSLFNLGDLNNYCAPFFHYLKSQASKERPNEDIRYLEALVNFYGGYPGRTVELTKDISSYSGMHHCCMWYYHICALQLIADPEISKAKEASFISAKHIVNDPAASQSEKYYAALLLELVQPAVSHDKLMELSGSGYLPAFLQIYETRIAAVKSLPDELDKQLRQMQAESYFYNVPFRELPVISFNDVEPDLIGTLLPLLQLMEAPMASGYLFSSQQDAGVHESPFDKPYLFLRHLRFENGQEFYRPAAVSNVFGNEEEQRLVQLDIQSFSSYGTDAFDQMGKRIHQEFFTSYMYAERDYKDVPEINTRHYLLVSSNLYKQGILTLDQCITLQQYIYYCLHKLTEVSPDPLFAFLIGEAKGFIDTASLLGIGFGTLEAAAKAGRHLVQGTNSPVVSFDVFAKPVAAASEAQP